MAKHAKHAADLDIAEDQLAEDSQDVSLEEAEAKAQGGAHARGFMKQDEDSEPDPNEPIEVTPEAVSSHEKDHVPLHQKKSKRMRAILTAAIVAIVLLLAGLGLFAWNLINESSNVADEVSKTEQVAPEGAVVSDAGSVSKQAEVPSLAGLLGLTQKQALAQLGDDAKVSSQKDITKEKTVKKKGKNGKVKKAKKDVVVGKSVTVSLGGSSSKDGTPTVYLTLNKKGKVTRAGFSASLSVLGYGNASFSSAVTEQHVVENIMTSAGVPLEEGSVKMPKEKEYRTYAADGKTIAQEKYVFSGKKKAVTGSKVSWSCRLNYDYSAANVSGNLADTIRQVYAYVEA